MLKEMEWLTINNILLKLYRQDDLVNLSHKLMRVLRMLIPYTKGYLLLLDEAGAIREEASSFVGMREKEVCAYLHKYDFQDYLRYLYDLSRDGEPRIPRSVPEAIRVRRADACMRKRRHPPCRRFSPKHSVPARSGPGTSAAANISISRRWARTRICPSCSTTCWIRPSATTCRTRSRRSIRRTSPAGTCS